MKEERNWEIEYLHIWQVQILKTLSVMHYLV